MPSTRVTDPIAAAAFGRTIPGNTTIDPVNLADCGKALTSNGTVRLRVVDSFHIKPVTSTSNGYGTAEYSVFDRTLNLTIKSIVADPSSFGTFIVTAEDTESDENFNTTREYIFTVSQESSPSPYTVRILEHGPNRFA